MFLADRVPFTGKHWALVLIALGGGAIALFETGPSSSVSVSIIGSLVLALLTGLFGALGDYQLHSEADATKHDIRVVMLVVHSITFVGSLVIYIAVHGGFPVPAPSSLVAPAAIGSIALGLGYQIYARLVSLKGEENRDLVTAKLLLQLGPFVQIIYLLVASGLFGLSVRSVHPAYLLAAAAVVVPVVLISLSPRLDWRRASVDVSSPSTSRPTAESRRVTPVSEFRE